MSGDLMESSADIYAAMIEDEDDDADKLLVTKKVVAPFGARNSVPVQHGEQTVEAATLAYVQQLERIVNQQRAEIRKLDRMVRTLGFMVKNQRDHANASTRVLQDVRRELDNKYDRRD